ncbi:serine/threonine-protein kinase [Actinomycetospora sp. TBRC 11914]|uniref:serine/threonine-protein kinase n=1 Tax=Actinomycetospora sp. TBRC 11914 TaxID=2729387 RepID=UPI00145C5E1B|nr:serine/threonine-protein kinase [Actinomycetospora sp. TBRC 11914]NMO92366.1 protein kinase [Actinomycetospora sp. TBRC 11914]
MTTVGIPALPDRLAARYEVGPVIGRGVGSSVFRAHDTLLGRDAAVKTFRVEADPRARRELSLLARMDHPGLVPVYDVDEHDGRAFVVMALLDGGSLAERLHEHGEESGGLALPEALRTAGTVAGALDHVHRGGVLHRAVTPANVLYDVDGRAHLSDFGVAFVADAPRITDTGLTVGAAPYLAPEQVRGEHAGTGADVYALGLVLIEALTGRRAFPGDPLSSAQARLDRDPTVPRGLPRDVTDLLSAMTRPDPDERPGAGAVAAALRHALVATEPLAVPSVLAGPGVTTSAPSRSGGPVGPWLPTRGRRAPTRRRRGPRATGTRGILVLGALAASALLAGTVALATSGPVAEIADSARPAVIVPGGATVGVPDPDVAAVPPMVAPASPPSGDAPSAAPTSDAPVEQSTSHPSRRTTAAAPVRQAAPASRPTQRPAPTTTTHTTRTTHSAPTTTTEPADDDQDPEDTTTPRPTDLVDGVLHGVDGLVGGALGGGRR